MSDVIDEDLMKELGLDDDDLKEIENKKQKKQSQNEKTAPKQALDADESMESLPNDSEPAKPEARAPQKALNQKPETPAKPSSKSDKEPASQSSKPANKSPQSDGLSSFNESMAKDVPVQLAVVMGKKTLSLGEVMQMKVGEVIEVHKKPSDPIDLVANGKLVAKAELVVVEGQVGVRILKLIQ